MGRPVLDLPPAELGPWLDLAQSKDAKEFLEPPVKLAPAGLSRINQRIGAYTINCWRKVGWGENKLARQAAAMR